MERWLIQRAAKYIVTNRKEADKRTFGGPQSWNEARKTEPNSKTEIKSQVDLQSVCLWCCCWHHRYQLPEGSPFLSTELVSSTSTPHPPLSLSLIVSSLMCPVCRNLTDLRFVPHEWEPCVWEVLPWCCFNSKDMFSSSEPGRGWGFSEVNVWKWSWYKIISQHLEHKSLVSHLFSSRMSFKKFSPLLIREYNPIGETGACWWTRTALTEAEANEPASVSTKVQTKTWSTVWI